MISSFYNDNDSYVAQWLGNLIAMGHLAAGTVDARSILEITAGELRSFRQCHFFAGIGGWPYALALAGWPADREVWTGSCPCQPLSSAGQRHGHADKRHLWPAFYRLIAERRPATIFGEQVASKDGREWLAGVRADLEALGYAVGCCDLPAAGVGAPHIRQRLFWVADEGGVAHADRMGRRARAGDEREKHKPEGGSAFADDGSATGGLGDAIGTRLEERPGERRDDEPQRAPAERDGGAVGRLGDAAEFGQRAAGRHDGFWSEERGASLWLPCLDGKARRIESGTFPLAHGVPASVGRLRGYGNAIVPQVAAEFIRAFIVCQCNRREQEAAA